MLSFDIMKPEKIFTRSCKFVYEHGKRPIFDRTRSIFANKSVYRGNFFILFSDMNSLVQDGFNGIHVI